MGTVATLYERHSRRQIGDFEVQRLVCVPVGEHRAIASGWLLSAHRVRRENGKYSVCVTFQRDNGVGPSASLMAGEPRWLHGRWGRTGQTVQIAAVELGGRYLERPEAVYVQVFTHAHAAQQQGQTDGAA